MREMLGAELPPGLPSTLELAKFRRRHMLRILIRDVLGFGTLPEITGELTALADTIGEPVAVIAHSYGGICALEATRLTPNIRRLVLYEPPIATDLPADVAVARPPLSASRWVARAAVALLIVALAFEVGSGRKVFGVEGLESVFSSVLLQHRALAFQSVKL